MNDLDGQNMKSNTSVSKPVCRSFWERISFMASEFFTESTSSELPRNSIECVNSFESAVGLGTALVGVAGVAGRILSTDLSRLDVLTPVSVTSIRFSRRSRTEHSRTNGWALLMGLTTVTAWIG